MARRLDVVFTEMLAALDGIQSATAGKNLDDFKSDWLLRHGVERGIEIISEASRHLPDGLIDHEPGIPWRQIRGVGNVLRHEYHRVSDAIVWTMVVDDLPPLRAAIIRLLDRSRQDPT